MSKGVLKITTQVSIEDGSVIIADAETLDLKRRLVTSTLEWGTDIALIQMGWTPPVEYFERPEYAPTFELQETADGKFRVLSNGELLAVTEHRWAARALASNQAMYRRLQELIHADDKSD